MKHSGLYRKGAAAERLLVNKLRKAGMYATRSAGSHGLFDVIAFNEHGLVLVQVKTGNASMSAKELVEARALRVPDNTNKYLAYVKGSKVVGWERLI